MDLTEHKFSRMYNSKTEIIRVGTTFFQEIKITETI